VNSGRAKRLLQLCTRSPGSTLRGKCIGARRPRAGASLSRPCAYRRASLPCRSVLSSAARQLHRRRLALSIVHSGAASCWPGVSAPPRGPAAACGSALALARPSPRRRRLGSTCPAVQYFFPPAIASSALTCQLC